MPNLLNRSLRAEDSHAGGAETTGPGAEQLRQIAASDAAFLTGFPCTAYQCQGTLATGDVGGHDVIVCSACETVYYRVADD